MRVEEMTDEAIDFMLGNFEPCVATKWEQSFVESVTDQWERNRHLSDNQKETLGKIWDRQP